MSFREKKGGSGGRKRPVSGGQWQNVKPFTPRLLAEISLGLRDLQLPGRKKMSSRDWSSLEKLLHGPVAPGFITAPDSHHGTAIRSWFLKQLPYPEIV